MGVTFQSHKDFECLIFPFHSIGMNYISINANGTLNQINVTENRRGKQKWTIRRHMQQDKQKWTIRRHMQQDKQKCDTETHVTRQTNM
jgi:Na+(H+)/acetate symporter ActP